MNRSGLLDFFPPPNFLVMPAAGISVESDFLRVVFFDRKHGQLVLKYTASVGLESGTIVAGEIIKPEKLITALKKIRSEHGVTTARVSLPEDKAYVYEANLPLPDDGDLRDAVEFSLDQNIPLPPSEVVFDYVVVDDTRSSEGNRTVKVAVTAYARNAVESWVEALSQAKIVPLSLMTESQAITRSVVKDSEKKAVMIAHFCKDKTVLAVTVGGLVRFTTTVASSTEDFEKILASHDGEKISESIELLAVRDEAKKVFSYWADRSKKGSVEGKISSLVVSGHVGGMADVAEYLGDHLGVPSALANVWVNVFSLNEYIPKLKFEDSLLFPASIGAAIS